MIVHAGLVAKYDGGKWRGVLIRGPSGSGKSDLAVRLLDRGFRLVADDRVKLFVAKDRIFGSAPSPLVGLLEVRGLGLLRLGPLRLTEIRLLVTCVVSDDAERIPKPLQICIAGVRLPITMVRALEPSAPAKLCHALEVLGSQAQQDYDPAFP